LRRTCFLCSATIRRCLPGARGDRRVDPRRAQCRNPARGDASCCHHHGHTDESDRIVPRDVEEQTANNDDHCENPNTSLLLNPM
jgi:hypothetical protein